MTARIHTEAAIVKVEAGAITIPVPHTAPEVAALQLEAETEAAFPDFTIDTPEEYTAVDAWLTRVVQKKDAVEAMEKSATKPLADVVATVKGWFKPVRTAFATTEQRLKFTMSAYRVKLDAAEREARQLVATTTGADLVDALAVADAAPPEGRATSRLVWVVERIVHDMVPNEYWIVDEKRIAEIARTHKGDDPPIVPGVVFKRGAVIGARR